CRKNSTRACNGGPEPAATEVPHARRAGGQDRCRSLLPDGAVRLPGAGSSGGAPRARPARPQPPPPRALACEPGRANRLRLPAQRHGPRVLQTALDALGAALRGTLPVCGDIGVGPAGILYHLAAPARRSVVARPFLARRRTPDRCRGPGPGER